MDLRNLFEDAEADTQASVLADRFYVALYGYVYDIVQRDGYMNVAEFEGVDCLAVGGHQVPKCPDEFADTLVIFNDSEFYKGGTALKLDLTNNGYTSAVILHAPAKKPKDVLSAVASEKGHNALLHELAHVLDFHRYQSGEMRTPPEDLSKYHNDSLELNAFFHNLAEPLLQRLRLVHTDGPEMLDLLPPIEGTFRDWFSNHTKRLRDPVLKRHWATLTEPNRRRAISRLKALYDRLETVSKTVDETP